MLMEKNETKQKSTGIIKSFQLHMNKKKKENLYGKKLTLKNIVIMCLPIILRTSIQHYYGQRGTNLICYNLTFLSFKEKKTLVI